MSWSMRGNGKLSLGHTMLRPIWSTHIFHLPPFFFYDDWVCDPVRMVDFADETRNESLLPVLLDDCRHLWREPSKLLTDRPVVRLYFEFVLSHLPRDSRHVR